jgi:hypothetical protein
MSRVPSALQINLPRASENDTVVSKRTALGIVGRRWWWWWWRRLWWWRWWWWWRWRRRQRWLCIRLRCQASAYVILKHKVLNTWCNMVPIYFVLYFVHNRLLLIPSMSQLKPVCFSINSILIQHACAVASLVNQIRSNPIKSNQIKSNQIKSNPY